MTRPFRILTVLAVLAVVGCWLLLNPTQVQVGPVILERKFVLDNPPEIMSAAMHGDVPRMTQLLDANPKMATACDEGGQSVLLFAVQYRHAEAVRLLLDRGASANELSSLETLEGPRNLLTPLLVAAEVGDLAIVQLLLSRGADPNIKNGRGESPSEVALQHQHPEVAALLRQHSR